MPARDGVRYVAGARVRADGRRAALLPLGPGLLDVGLIGMPGFFKKPTLFGRERFVLVGEADAFVVCQI